MVDKPRTLPVIEAGEPERATPVFPKIGIVGLGLIGGSIALAARRAWPQGFLIAVDDNAVLERAMVLNAVDVGADDPVVLAEADLVVLAAPVRQNIAILAELGDYVQGTAVVTDVGSTKRATVEAARALPPRLPFVGGHPLGGAARSGIEHARPDLFGGRPWIFTPTEESDSATIEKLSAFASALGARPLRMDPATHDRLMAYLSHLPQLAASALMHVIGEHAGEESLALAGRGLADTTRLAASPSHIWLDICSTNAEEVGAALDALIRVLASLRGDLRSGAVLEEVFTSANAWRARLPADRPTAAGSAR